MKKLLCIAMVLLFFVSCTYTSKMSYYRQQSQPVMYAVPPPEVLQNPNGYTHSTRYYNSNTDIPSNYAPSIPAYYVQAPRQNQTNQFLLGAVTGYLVNDITHRLGNNYRQGYHYRPYSNSSYQYQSPYYRPWSPPSYYTPWMSNFGTNYNRGFNKVYSDIYRGYQNGYGQVMQGYYQMR